MILRPPLGDFKGALSEFKCRLVILRLGEEEERREARQPKGEEEKVCNICLFFGVLWLKKNSD